MIDVSCPNVIRVALNRLNKLNNPSSEETDFTQKLTPRQLYFMLTNPSNPFFSAIEDCRCSNYSEDQGNSKLNSNQIACFVNLLICQGSALNLNGLDDQQKNLVINALKTIAHSKTGFQGLLSLLIATTLNSDPNLCFHENLTSIEIESDPTAENCFYHTIEKKIILKDLTKLDLDRILVHEIAHARHDILNLATWKIPLPFTYFSVAKNHDLLAKLIPVDPSPLTTPLKIDITNVLKKFLIANGFGEICDQLTAEEIYSFYQELHKIKLGTNDYYDLWDNSDEMTTILGICPLFVKKQLYVVEDRQNEAQYQRRKPYIISTIAREKSNLRLIYICHNSEPCPKIIEHLFDPAPANFADYRTRDPKDLALQLLKKRGITLSEDQQTLTIANNVTKISSDDFADLAHFPELISQIKTITIQPNAKITKIPDHCFGAFPNLKKLDLGTNSQIKSIGCRCVSGSASKSSTLSELSIPTNVEKIADYAFHLDKSCRLTFENNSSHLKTLGFTCFGNNFNFTRNNLPDGISSWNQAILLKQCDQYFNLENKTLKISGDVENLPSIYVLGRIIRNYQLSRRILKEAEQVEFERDDNGQTKITEFPAGNLITELIHLKKLTIPKIITKISGEIFNRSPKIKIILEDGLSPDLELPPQLKIGRNFSIECPKALNSLKERFIATFNGENHNSESAKKYPITISDDGTKLQIADYLTEVNEEDLVSIPLPIREKINTITFADHCQITEIPSECFSSLRNLKQINFGSQMNLISISNTAFYGNIEGIKTINNFPTSLENVGYHAFSLANDAQINFEKNSSHLKNISAESLVTMFGDDIETFALPFDQLPPDLSLGVKACLTQNYQDLLKIKKDEAGTTLIVAPSVTTLPVDLATYQNALNDDTFSFDQIKKITFTPTSNLINLTGLICFDQINEQIKIPASCLVDEYFTDITGNYEPDELSLKYSFEDQKTEERWETFLQQLLS